MRKFLKLKYLIITIIACILITCIIFFISSNNDEKIQVSNYTIYFDTIGGSSIANQTVQDGNYVQQPNIPTKDGYIFLGWFYNDKKFDFNTNINKDITLVAKWELKEKIEFVKVSFDSQGGNNISAIEIKKDSPIIEPISPKKTGYTFLGWYLNNQKFDFNTNINKDITLIAKWKKMENNQNSTQNNKNENTIQNNNKEDIGKPNDSQTNDDNKNYTFQYDAFKTIICKYKSFYTKVADTGLCYDAESIDASYTMGCPNGSYENSDGNCQEEIVNYAKYNRYCKEGQIEKNDLCYEKRSESDRAIGICPEGYEYRYGGWGLEKGYCYNSETREKNYDIVTYTCVGVVGVAEPKLVITNDKAYCEGYVTSRTPECGFIYDYYCEDGLILTGPTSSIGYLTHDAKCVEINIRQKEKKYYCPSDYTLFDTHCNPNEDIRNAPYTIEYSCPEGLIMIDNKCYTIEN